MRNRPGSRRALARPSACRPAGLRKSRPSQTPEASLLAGAGQRRPRREHGAGGVAFAARAARRGPLPPTERGEIDPRSCDPPSRKLVAGADRLRVVRIAEVIVEADFTKAVLQRANVLTERAML